MTTAWRVMVLRTLQLSWSVVMSGKTRTRAACRSTRGTEKQPRNPKQRLARLPQTTRHRYTKPQPPASLSWLPCLSTPCSKDCPWDSRTASEPPGSCSSPSRSTSTS
uniref:Putative secreted protein n=1 Tax=Ixodes scapularis TaxID=6945 RepID=A0A4D5RY08_IXOSC